MSKAEVMAQRGDDDFIVESDVESFLVQENRVSIIHNVDSLLARGYWEEPSASTAKRSRAIGLVESFIEGTSVIP